MSREKLPGEDQETKDHILDEVSDLVGEFLYYARREDETLPPGDIERAIVEKVVTVDEIVAKFRAALEEGLS